MLLGIAIVLAIFWLEPPWSWAVIALGGTLDIGETLAFIWWSKRRAATVGAQTLVGRRGVAVSALWPDGQVKVGGELWSARCRGGVDAGAEVVVTGVDGLTLDVEPA